jgi:acetyl esterase/lipase
MAQPGPPPPPLFQPPGERERHHPTGADLHTALTYSCPDGYRPLQLDLYVPSSRSAPAPLVIWIHGGAWLMGTRESAPYAWPAGAVFQAAIDAGLAIASIDYRHSREAAFPAQLHDAKAAVRYLRHFAGELGLDPERIAVWGESAGGHLAALLALVDDPELEGIDGVTGPSSAVSAVVDYYGVSDVETLPPFGANFPPAWLEELKRQGKGAPPEPIDVLLEFSPYTREEGRRLVSPVSHVRADAPPFLLIHGEADGLVPIGQSEALLAALEGAGVEAELVRVPGADHVFLGTDAAPQHERAIAFLRRHLDA